MENKVKAKLIINALTSLARGASISHIRAVADQAGEQKGYDLWKKDLSSDLGWNPYSIESREKLAREEVLAYAIDVFLEKIPNQEEKV